jgi:dienelactone hydrolase
MRSRPCVGVRSHASELGIDPKRIGAGGGSAGGHLAAFVGLVEGQDDPQDDLKLSAKADALVLFNPVFDNGPDGGWGQARVGDRVQEFSPAHNISADDPPAIVFLGTRDNLIPVATVERFQAKMKAAGVRCEAVFYDGQPHGFFNDAPWKSRTLIEADKFLRFARLASGAADLQGALGRGHSAGRNEEKEEASRQLKSSARRPAPRDRVDHHAQRGRACFLRQGKIWAGQKLPGIRTDGSGTMRRDSLRR